MVDIAFPKLRGGNNALIDAREPEILIEGPSGTGKTTAVLWLIHLLCHNFPGMRALIVRKHQVTLTTTCLVTLNKKVLISDPTVQFFGGSKSEPAAYRYPNGSVIVTGGMDRSDKILSSEYDLIYENEVTELTEDDHETLLTRLRNGVLKSMRIIADCNPSAAKSWVNRRCESGKMRRIKTSHRDNPEYFNDEGDATSTGAQYLSRLENLSGARRQRFLLGEWVGVENAVYPQFDRAIHVRDLEPGLRFSRTVMGVDYGRRHKSALVVISVDQYGRRWVREAWAEPAEADNSNLLNAAGNLRGRYKATRGRTDPLQSVLAGLLGFNVAKGQAGSRNERTKITGRLLNTFPGGRVPAMTLELNERRFLKEFPQPPFKEDDSPGLLFVRGAPSIEELCDQIEDYHEVLLETDVKQDFVVARINDDLVAALEYACEELEDSGPDYSQALPQGMSDDGAYVRPRAIIGAP